MTNNDSEGRDAETSVPGQAKFLTANQLARITGLSLATVHRYKAAGLIPYWQPRKGGRVLFPVEAVDRMCKPAVEAGRKPLGASQGLAGPRPRWQASLSSE